MKQSTTREQVPAETDLTIPPATIQTIARYYRINRKDISFLRFILEAYEGIAVLTTMDPLEGVVKVTMAPGCEQMVGDLLTTMHNRRDIFLEPLPDFKTASQGNE